MATTKRLTDNSILENIPDYNQKVIFFNPITGEIGRCTVSTILSLMDSIVPTPTVTITPSINNSNNEFNSDFSNEFNI